MDYLEVDSLIVVQIKASEVVLCYLYHQGEMLVAPEIERKDLRREGDQKSMF